jgi:hypothetical protein
MRVLHQPPGQLMDFPGHLVLGDPGATPRVAGHAQEDWVALAAACFPPVAFNPNGTRHAWRSKGTDGVTMLFVLHGAKK